MSENMFFEQFLKPAIMSGGENGTSHNAIVKYILNNGVFSKPESDVKTVINNSLRAALNIGTIVNISGRGLRGSFKIVKNEIDSMEESHEVGTKNVLKNDMSTQCKLEDFKCENCEESFQETKRFFEHCEEAKEKLKDLEEKFESMKDHVREFFECVQFGNNQEIKDSILALRNDLDIEDPM